jgi:hypothetical protein
VLSAYRRLAALDHARRLLLIEAAVSLAFVSGGLRVMPFLRLQRLLDRCVPLPIAGRAADPNVVSSVTWAVTAIAARFPPATCLVQALAAATLLRRRGLPSQLCIGVRTRGTAAGAPIEAHAWVECDGRIAIGEVAHLSEMAVLASERHER